MPAMAVCMGKKMKLPYDKSRLENLELTPIEVQIEKENIIYVNDAYNASPISVSFS